MDVLHQLNADGHTVIIVTHDREVAQQAQRIVEISDGQVVADHAARDNRDVQRLPAVQDNGRASLSRSIGESVRMAWRSLLGHRMRAFCRCWGLSSAFRPWFPPWRWEKAPGRAS
jgi:macrolide transport system ATP-binding/permease protein